MESSFLERDLSSLSTAGDVGGGFGLGVDIVSGWEGVLSEGLCALVAKKYR